MRRKTARKDKKDTKDSVPKPVNDPRDADRKEDGGRADFGGLPDRDLKKNLGCG